MTDLLSRKAGRAETLVQPAPKAKAEPMVVDPSIRSAASLKRQRKKEEKELAAKVQVQEYLSTGAVKAQEPGYVSSGAASSNGGGLRPETPSNSDDEEERELLAKMAAVKLRKAMKEGMHVQDGAAVEVAMEVKAVDPYQSVCVGSAAGSEVVTKAVGGPAVKKEKGPKMESSGRNIVKGKGKRAAMSKGTGEGEVMAVDPYQFVCVGSAAGSEPELGGHSDFYPARDLSPDSQLKEMKKLTCCNCGKGPLKQSEMVLAGGGKDASWQGKVFGWCRDCMDLPEKEFKSQSRITWNFRIHESGKTRERAMFASYENVSALIRSDFPGASHDAIRELTVKRNRALCIAWACSMEKENTFLQQARRIVQDEWLTDVQRAAEDPTYACSIDGKMLKSREISFLTTVADGIQLCYCCRNPKCLYYGMNSEWLNKQGTNEFRCPCCIDKYSPTSVVGGQVPWSFVLQMPDFETGETVAIPAMWPPSQDMAWLNKNIEAFALQISSEVQLAEYKAHGKADLHKLLAAEAVPKEFIQVPFASHPDADLGRLAWQPWDLEKFQAKGYVNGNRLNSAVDDLSHPYSNWTEFIAICGRITAEGRATCAKDVARLIVK